MNRFGLPKRNIPFVSRIEYFLFEILLPIIAIGLLFLIVCGTVLHY